MSAAQDNAALVADMVREFDFARYAAALFAPAATRRAMLALAAFDLDVMRIPDQVSQPLPGEVRLQWWRDAIEGTAHGGIGGHPVAAELLDALDRFDLPRAPLLSLIDAHTFDLYAEAMPSRAALEVYCDDTCGSSIALNAEILMPREVSSEVVRPAGRALGLLRAIGRLPHDAAHGRCVLPLDDMVAAGVTRQQVLAGEDSDNLRTLRAALLEHAAGQARVVRSALRRLPRAVRPALLPLATVMREYDALRQSSTFALVPTPSRLRVLSAQAWAMR